MSKIFKPILKVALGLILDAAKSIAWEKVSYEILMEQLIPFLEEKAADTSSNVDDKLVQFAKDTIEKYLK